MSKALEILREANRLRAVGRDAYEKAAEFEKQYNAIKNQERRDAMSAEERALEDQARASEGVCGCICGCNNTIRGGYVYGGRIHFGTCDSCDICS